MVRAGEIDSRFGSAGDNETAESDEDGDQAAWQGDLLVVEDLQHLRAEAAQTLVQLLDRCVSRRRLVVCTASVGPGHLGHLPARLTSRLAGGLVVGLESFGPTGRLAFLRDRAQRRQLAVSADVLSWLADHLGGSGRQLEGAIARLEELTRIHDRLPDVETVASHFQDDVDASRPTVERIVERVSRYFCIDRRQLRSRRRLRSVLVPRQVSMYLARRLTGLSLEQIGAYFGGRDHSTVLHACRKIDQALSHDARLSGAVRRLQADLA
jgi:chromosomal replication initiator protein